MTAPLPRSALIDLLVRFRKEQERGDAATIRQLADAYGKIHRRLQDELELEVRRIFEQPESIVTRSYITRRLERLTEQVQSELEKYQAFLATTVETSTDAALLQGSKHALELMKIATLGKTAITGINFGTLNPSQVNTMIAFLSPNSPLFRNIEKLAKFHAPAIRDQLVEAVALGYGPGKAAGNITPLLTKAAKQFELSLARPFADAVRLARTSIIYSYREATRANYQANSDVVTGWQWYADLGGACASCIAMHGTVHPLDEVLNDHHHGRCAQLPVVLGNAFVSESAGVEYFNKLDEAKQQELLGPGAFQAWKDGKFDFSQVSRERDDDVYGPMRSVASLKDLVGEE